MLEGGREGVANWKPRVAASNLSRRQRRHRPRRRARQLRPARRLGGVADIEVNKKTGKITVKHVYGAQDAGPRRQPGGWSRTRWSAALIQGVEPRAPRGGRASTRSASRASTGSPTRSCASRTRRRSRRSSSSGSDQPPTGAGEPPCRRDPGGDRQRVLRRDGRAHPRGADDAGPRPRGAQGSRGRRRLPSDERGGRALRGPPASSQREVSVVLSPSPARHGRSRGARPSPAPSASQSSFAASIVPARLNADNILEVRLDNGARIRTASAPGAVIPPGTYAAVVISEVPEFRDDYHMFHLTGPGVNLQTDLLAGDERAEPHIVTLLPNSIYIFRDDRNPALGSVVFSTSGAGTAVTGGERRLVRGGSSGGGTTSNTPTSTSRTRTTVGSKVLPVARHAGRRRRPRPGRLSLTVQGQGAWARSRSGRYKVSVLDETAKAAFILQQLRTSSRVTLSGEGVRRAAHGDGDAEGRASGCSTPRPARRRSSSSSRADRRVLQRAFARLGRRRARPRRRGCCDL